jgi:CheY-like chemotaxis protein
LINALKRQVVQVEDQDQELEEQQEETSEAELIITDLHMPNVNGITPVGHLPAGIQLL